MTRDRDAENDDLSPEEIAQLKKVMPYFSDMIDMVSSKRAITGVYRGVRVFCVWFIGMSALAIAFKQSVLDLINTLRGLFR